MKTKSKGIIFFAFVGVIMLASGITIAIPTAFFDVPESDNDITETSKIISKAGTGTPLDNIPLEQQDELCESFYKFKKKDIWLNYWENIFNLSKIYPIVNTNNYDLIFDLTDVVKNNFITMEQDYLYSNILIV